MKSCSLKEDEPLAPRSIEGLLEFMAVFETDGFCPGGGIPLDEEGWPVAEFAAIVSRFLDACYQNGFVVKFDWAAWEAKALEYMHEPALLQSADLAVLRRLLTWHVRQNRSHRDHLAGMIASGHALAILRRLKTLAAR
jgi:hypothetical protein